MYEALGWIALSETPEEDDVGGLQSALQDLRTVIRDSERYLPNLSIELKGQNGGFCLLVAAHFNRPGERAQVLHDVFNFVEQRLPGSWGVLHEHDDETTDPPGPNAYRVTVMARGRQVQRDDPFFSPIIPTVQD